jgi:hypothetical protein
MFKRWLRDEPELPALAIIVFFFAAASVEQPPMRFSGDGLVYQPRPPEVRLGVPDLPPPVNPIELIRF